MALNKATDLEGMKGWDLDLKFGKHFEELIDDIFSGKYKCEVKTERDKWIGYKNMVIETEYRGKPSGLTRTDADIWVHNFSYKGELIFSLMLPTDILKEVVKNMEEDGLVRVVKGGDNWNSKLSLVPIEKVLTYFIKYAKENKNG